MAKVTVKLKPPVPVEPEIESVILELTPDEALYLELYFGHTYFHLRRAHMKEATNFETFEKFYPGTKFNDIGSEIYIALVYKLGIGQK